MNDDERDFEEERAAEKHYREVEQDGGDDVVTVTVTYRMRLVDGSANATGYVVGDCIGGRLFERPAESYDGQYNVAISRGDEVLDQGSYYGHTAASRL
jgi:hypothetical protein